MSDTFITMVTVVLALIIMFVFPLIFIGNQSEIITGDDIKTLADNFVNQVSVEGKLTANNYYEFLQKLNATGNTYNVSLEIQILDNSNLTNADNIYLVGENMHYSVFTSEIEDEINTYGEYILKQGDYIKVKIENTNITFGTQMKRLIYGILGKDIITIDTNSSAIVVAPGLDASDLATEPTPPIDLKGLKWERDYYWVNDEEEWDASDRMVSDGSISRIRIDRAENGANIVEMIGNSVDEGKGAAWATLEGYQIRQISFSYDLDEGDSFYDAGIMLNIDVSDDEKTLSGYLIAFCFRDSYGIYSNKFDGGGILNRAGYQATNDETGAIMKFTYEIGTYSGRPELNRELMINKDFFPEKLEVLATFNAARNTGGRSGSFRNRTYKGKVKIRVVDEGYLINISTGRGVFEYTIEVDKSDMKTNTLGFFSEHHIHSCQQIGHFKLYNVNVRGTK